MADIMHVGRFPVDPKKKKNRTRIGSNEAHVLEIPSAGIRRIATSPRLSLPRRSSSSVGWGDALVATSKIQLTFTPFSVDGGSVLATSAEFLENERCFVNRQPRARSGAARVTILKPPTAIAARWNGALEARLRRAPLEAFLRSRSLPFVSEGVSQDTDNVATATVAIVSTGLDLYTADPDRRLSAAQLEEVAQIACVVSDSLATLIREPNSWRIAALVSAAQLLRAHIGLFAAARLSAGTARTYRTKMRKDISRADVRARAAWAVEKNDDLHYQAASEVIARRLIVR